MTSERLQALADFYQGLSRESLPGLRRLYAEQARFRDPFNDVRGVEAIGAIFEHMFDACVTPRFHVTHGAEAGDIGYLHWQFRFALRRGGGSREYCIEGVSRLCFDDQGRVREHLDFWDPAASLYHHIPGLGWLLGRLRQRLAAPRPGVKQERRLDHG